MDSRIPKNITTHDTFEQELAEISTKIRRELEAVISDNWKKAVVVVCEASPESDDLLEIEEPVWNPTSIEILGSASGPLMQALEEMYLLFYPERRPWQACEVSLDRTLSGKHEFSTKFRYQGKDDTIGDIPF